MRDGVYQKIMNDIDNGFYFGKRNTYTENQNIFTGIINSKNNYIKWELIKI